MDYVLTESPPLFLGISGFFISKLKGAKWIFNVADLWPESAVHLGVLDEGLFLKLAEMLEAFCYRHAWMVTGQSESILESIHSRFPEIRTYHLSNGVNCEKFNSLIMGNNHRNDLADEDEIIIFYGGLHGLAQGLDQILYAAKEVPECVRFIFLGDGPEKEYLINLANGMELLNIEFLDPVSKNEMPGILASVDICLVPLKKAIPGAVPSKLYEAMASSKPVIMIAEGEAKEIVERNKCGIVVSPGDIQGIVDAINILVENPPLRIRMGENGRKAALEDYSRIEIINKFANFLRYSQN